VSDARHVLGLRVDATSYSEAVDQVLAWASRGESRYVCFANVHMTMETVDHPTFREVVNGADLVAPDGMPLVWALRRLGAREATRVYGPDFVPALCGRAAATGVPVGFYGGRPEVLDRLVRILKDRYPALAVGFAESPPFRPLTGAEDAALVQRVRASGVPILFVGLGCPKQEMWMAARKGSIPTVMLGVGAAFDFLAGAKLQAPRWMGQAGLEWLFRLATEPRRLWRRYLYHNPRFVVGFVRQLLRAGRRQRAGRRRRADAPD